MNLGIYVHSLGDDETTSWALKTIDYGLQNKIINDASIFYDNIGFTPYYYPCGLFNSTDLWNFYGTLIVMNKDCLFTACKIINNINIVYYHGWEKDVSVFDLIYATSKSPLTITNNENNQKELYRLTGIESEILDTQTILDKLSGRAP